MLDGLPGGGLNIAHEAVARHVATGRGGQDAIRWIGREGARRDTTYADLAGMTALRQGPRRPWRRSGRPRLRADGPGAGALCGGARPPQGGHGLRAAHRRLRPRADPGAAGDRRGLGPRHRRDAPPAQDRGMAGADPVAEARPRRRRRGARWYGIRESERVEVWYIAPAAIRTMMRGGRAAARGAALAFAGRLVRPRPRPARPDPGDAGGRAGCSGRRSKSRTRC